MEDATSSLTFVYGTEPRRIVAGKYLIRGLLGEGGMGRVFRVRHLLLDCDRALKTIRHGLVRLDLLHRLEREARAMARFRHAHAVGVHDMGMDDGLAYIEMDLVPGLSLDRVLRRGVPFPPARALDLALQLCEVLEAAHACRIVHRDLKPANLMLEPASAGGSETLRVLDFGLAKMLDEEYTNVLLTPRGELLGTVAYLSPEQARGDQVDARSDIYSTGVILYEMLTGRRPFTGTFHGILEAHKNAVPPPFPNRLGLPAGLRDLVFRCLEKDPGLRPGSARDLATGMRDLRLT